MEMIFFKNNNSSLMKYRYKIIGKQISIKIPLELIQLNILIKDES